MTQEAAPHSKSLSLWPYIVVWLTISLWLTYEYILMNSSIQGPSLLGWLHQRRIILPGNPLNPNPGGALSFRLGILGFITICLTNFYTLRKKFRLMRKLGSINTWLNFHIFCGLLGTTIVIFHTNLKISGIAAVSFWSMMITFLSGVAGRYLYLQLLVEKNELQANIDFYLRGFEKCRRVVKPEISRDDVRKMKKRALALAGINEEITKGHASLLTVFFASIKGDINMFMRPPQIPKGMPRIMRTYLREYAIITRRYVTNNYFKRIMGYWHVFHLPFALCMYALTIIHIISALTFRVNH